MLEIQTEIFVQRRQTARAIDKCFSVQVWTAKQFIFSLETSYFQFFSEVRECHAVLASIKYCI